jgi:translation initiation factor 1
VGAIMARDPNTRLVYSTGDPVAAEPRKHGQRPQPRSAPAAAGSGIRLRLDRRASSRLVTVLTGVPGSPADLSALGRELRAACGAGGAVKDGAIELQGDHRDAVEAALTARGLKWKRTGG